MELLVDNGVALNFILCHFVHVYSDNCPIIVGIKYCIMWLSDAVGYST